jgi:hypothetical protein
MSVMVEHDRCSYEQSVVKYCIMSLIIYISITKICTKVHGSAWISTSKKLGSLVCGTRKSETQIRSVDPSAHTHIYLNTDLC